MPTKKQIDEAIADVCTEIIREPLLFFSEADVKQLLAERLRQVPGLGRQVNTGHEKGRGSKAMYKTSLLHCEYGAGSGQRTDIVIFDRRDVAKIKGTNLDRGAGKYLKPQFAFELGTEKSSDIMGHLKKDHAKVARASECGYIIHFYRDTTRSNSPGLRGRTDKKIRDQFRTPVQMQRGRLKNNTRVLAILLRTARDVKRMQGKCEICVGSADGDWKQPNVARVSDIKRDILRALL